MEPLSLAKWELIDLPWAIFWLKELLAWGTLEPVAAFLLSNGMELTRANAEKSALAYYSSTNEPASDKVLDPRRIRDWAMTTYPRDSKHFESVNETFAATTQDMSFQGYSGDQRVLPVFKNNRVEWFDVAGHHLANSVLSEASIIQTLDIPMQDFFWRPQENKVFHQRFV